MTLRSYFKMPKSNQRISRRHPSTLDNVELLVLRILWVKPTCTNKPSVTSYYLGGQQALFLDLRRVFHREETTSARMRKRYCSDLYTKTWTLYYNRRNKAMDMKIDMESCTIEDYVAPPLLLPSAYETRVVVWILINHRELTKGC